MAARAVAPLAVPSAPPPPRRQRRLPATAAVQPFQLDSGVVALAPARRRPKGLIHFVGGAFVGAAPVPSYSLLLELLADGGFTVVATPYAVSFQHLQCARAVGAAFEAAVRQLRSQQGSWAAPPGLPVHGVGHSNGSLLHLLLGSADLLAQEGALLSGGTAGRGGLAGGGSGDLVPKGLPPPDPRLQPVSNVLMSYNNFRVGKAVPVPLSLLAPAVQQARGGGRLADGAAAALQQAAAAARPLLAQQPQLLRDLQQWDPAVVQLGSVFDEVGDGLEDFSPTPEEARQLIGAGYGVPDTLLIQFTNDDTDETPAAAAMLAAPPAAPRSLTASGNSNGSGSGSSPRLARRVGTLVLPGTHVTPCGGQLVPRVPPGRAFGPAEAVGMAVQAAVQGDTYRLAGRVLDYLDARS